MFQLRKLILHGLENVPVGSSAGMSMISRKEHLDYLELNWSSSGSMGLREEINKPQQQRAVEEVTEKPSPPSSIRHLNIEGYFGSRLPNWMIFPATWVFNRLMHLRIDKLHYCTQLPKVCASSLFWRPWSLTTHLPSRVLVLSSSHPPPWQWVEVLLLLDQ